VDFCTFVDDAWPTGPSKREAWLGARSIGSSLGWLGIQDAPRKQRDSSRTPGAWTGSVLQTEGGEVSVMVGKDKWIKAKGVIQEICDMLDVDPKALPRKRLEQIRGYLVHIAQTYPMFSCYLIGLHMTIDCWRPNRDEEGWRYTAAYIQALKDGGDWPDDYDHSKGPKFVKAVPRLDNDIKALESLTTGDDPIARRVRGRKTGRVVYGFGDASGVAHGATVQLEGGLYYQYGQWSSEIVENSSSNWKELANLVNCMTKLG
jgi:hypothetical protein